LSSSQGYDYDENGALVEDANGKRFGYDAESHQKEFFAASNSTSTPDAIYSYDGQGRRVKKVVGSEVTVFVYDAAGQLSAEYSSSVASAQDSQVNYLTTDHLGSPRIITDANGAVTSRKDFTAFGEEVSSSQRVGGSTGNNYEPSTIRQDYTGYQKDSESGLEFAQARYYNAGHGRFTSVDPLTASATIRNPQTFNRYSYTLNSPYKFTDPLGLMTGAPNPDSGMYITSDPTLDSKLTRVWAHNFRKSTQPPPTPTAQQQSQQPGYTEWCGGGPLATQGTTQGTTPPSTEPAAPVNAVLGVSFEGLLSDSVEQDPNNPNSTDRYVTVGASFSIEVDGADFTVAGSGAMGIISVDIGMTTGSASLVQVPATEYLIAPDATPDLNNLADASGVTVQGTVKLYRDQKPAGEFDFQASAFIANGQVRGNISVTQMRPAPNIPLNVLTPQQ